MHRLKSKYKFIKASIQPVLIILGLLTAFSSCAMKKTMQAEIGVEVQNQLNPLKSNLNEKTVCDADKTIRVESTASVKTEKFQFYPYFGTSREIARWFSVRPAQSAVRVSILNHRNRPLYILLQKMKFCA